MEYSWHHDDAFGPSVRETEDGAMKQQGEMERISVLVHMQVRSFYGDRARWYTAGQLSAELNMDPKKMYRILNYLLDEGRVIKKKHFGYANEWRCLTLPEERERAQ